MPSPAPTPSYLQSLILLQTRQRETDGRSQNTLPQCPPHFQDHTLLSAQKLKQLQRPSSPIGPAPSCQSSSPSSPSPISSPSISNLTESRHYTAPHTSGEDGPLYYARRTSNTFRSSFSASLPTFESFGFGPDDFLNPSEYDDEEREREQKESIHDRYEEETDERDGRYNSHRHRYSGNTENEDVNRSTSGSSISTNTITNSASTSPSNSSIYDRNS
ncbi:hypothetical protein BGZ92_004292, partial [Podila epicladia]